jgi:hypothetical protein
MKQFPDIRVIFLLCFIVFSCKNNGKTGLPVILVNVEQEVSLNLSEIAHNIKSIGLELTDQSLIKQIIKVLDCKEYIIVAERNGIMQFTCEGKFIRRIGTKGQGPGEYNNIIDITFDFKNKLLYVIDTRKIISYDSEGILVRELSTSESSLGMSKHINFIENELLLMSEHFAESIGDRRCNRAMIYKFNRNLQLTDSLEVRTVCLDKPGFWFNPFTDYLTWNEKNIQLYFPEMNPEPFVRDTLYTVKDKQLIPKLRLQFKNNGIGSENMKFVYLFNIYESSRFVFSVYMDTRDGKQDIYQFCFDNQTQKTYNMKDGFIDDIYNIEERVRIRPLNSNVEQFYYLHANLNNLSGEEPNPTLYIGTLKK